jgi:hypothetical protein
MKSYLKARREWEEEHRVAGEVISPRNIETEDEEEEKLLGVKRPCKAVILMDEFKEIVDRHIGRKCSPILDIIAWHIHRIDDDVITFTKN